MFIVFLAIKRRQTDRLSERLKQASCPTLALQVCILCIFLYAALKNSYCATPYRALDVFHWSLSFYTFPVFNSDPIRLLCEPQSANSYSAAVPH